MALTKVDEDMLETPPVNTPPSMQFFTASGTWTKPVGCTSVKVTVVGAGGGSAGQNAAGGQGGTSSFGSHCSATGGGGGNVLGNTIGVIGGPSGGSGSGGDLNISGHSGEGGHSDDGSRVNYASGGASVAYGFGRGRQGSVTSRVVSGSASGGAAIKVIDVSAISSEVVTVGAGGAAGSGSGGIAGEAGGVVVEEFYG